MTTAKSLQTSRAHRTARSRPPRYRAKLARAHSNLNRLLAAHTGGAFQIMAFVIPVNGSINRGIRTLAFISLWKVSTICPSLITTTPTSVTRSPTSGDRLVVSKSRMAIGSVAGIVAFKEADLSHNAGNALRCHDG